MADHGRSVGADASVGDFPDASPREDAERERSASGDADRAPWTGQGPVIANPPSPHEPFGRAPLQRPGAAHRARRRVAPVIWTTLAVLVLIALVVLGLPVLF